MYYPYLMYITYNDGTIFQLLSICYSTDIGFGTDRLVPDTATSSWLAFYIAKN